MFKKLISIFIVAILSATLLSACMPDRPSQPLTFEQKYQIFNDRIQLVSGAADSYITSIDGPDNIEFGLSGGKI